MKKFSNKKKSKISAEDSTGVKVNIFFESCFLYLQVMANLIVISLNMALVCNTTGVKMMTICFFLFIK